MIAELGALRALFAAPASGEALRMFQARRLRDLLDHAYQRVPYYRRLFGRARLTPQDIRTLDDLSRIPISEKSDFREAPEEDVITRGIDRRDIITYPTSGSTGVPMIVRCTLFESRLLQAFRMQAMIRVGLRPNDRRSLVFAASADDKPGLIERVGLFRSRRINARWPLDRCVSSLRIWNPDVIRGYPSVLSTLAAQLTSKDRAQIRPRFVTTDSESLTDQMRRQIEEGFGAPVFDFYDCFEANVLAHQCARRQHYHVLDAAVIVEILKDGRPVATGESGDVVITSLHSWAAPLIRYRIGDIAERGPDRCPCGAPNSCIARVQGRAQDALRFADGRRLHPVAVVAGSIYPLLPTLRRYQIQQTAIDRILILLQPAPGSTPSAGRIEAMAASLRRDLGEAIRVETRIVEEIPAEPNGKFRTFRGLAGSDVP